MRTEALFFKTLFLVFVAFYFSALMIWLFFFVTTTDHFADIATMLCTAFAISLVSSLLFSPVLLLVSFIQWGIRNKWLKNVISFLLIIIYGFLIFKAPSFRFYNTNLPDIIDETLSYLSILIPSTLLFMALLSYLTQYQKSRGVS